MCNNGGVERGHTSVLHIWAITPSQSKKNKRKKKENSACRRWVPHHTGLNTHPTPTPNDIRASVALRQLIVSLSLCPIKKRLHFMILFTGHVLFAIAITLSLFILSLVCALRPELHAFFCHNPHMVALPCFLSFYFKLVPTAKKKRGLCMLGKPLLLLFLFSIICPARQQHPLQHLRFVFLREPNGDHRFHMIVIRRNGRTSRSTWW